MKRLLLISFFVAVANTFVFAQIDKPNEGELTTVDLYSPWDFSGERPIASPALRAKSCLDMLRLVIRCDSAQSLSYGNRIGLNWDIFAVDAGRDSGTRMVDLGRFNWQDRFDVPYIEPWAPLRPGEKRNISINTSGADAGKNNGYADKPVTKQVSTTVTSPLGNRRPSTYSPFMEAKKRHMYAVHVVDPHNDYYLLIHVDDLVRGIKATISFKKLDVPPKKPIFF